MLTNNQIVAFNTENAAGADAPVTVTGLNTGDNLVSIDRRPVNGDLYGLGYNAISGTVTLYKVTSQNGIAVALGTASDFSDGTASVRVGVDGNTKFGLDFNPTVDRARVVTSNGPATAGQNFRINPNTGAFVDGDTLTSGVNLDGNINGAVTSVDEAAYTNNESTESATTLYTLDSTSDQLYIQNPPNNGTQTSAIPLSQAVDSVSGFDIQPGVNANASNTAVTVGSGYAVIKKTGDAAQTLSRIDLTNGALTNLGQIGSNASGILGLALQKTTSTSIVGLTADGASLLRFNSMTPEQVTTTSVSGVASGEVLVGLDFRPKTGQLFALGINEATDVGSLYLIDPQTASATLVGNTNGLINFVTSTSTAVDLPAPASGYGLNFNPTVDRIRVVTGTGLNFRINPDTGLPVDGDEGGVTGSVSGTNTDGNISGASSSVQATSYTNSFPQSGVGVTTQYAINAGTNTLYIQNPPNAGTQTLGKSLTVAGLPLNATAVSGFDIPSSVTVDVAGAAVGNGSAFATFEVAGVTGLYRVDLSNGSSRLVGVVGNGSIPLRGIATSETTVK